MSDTLKLLSIKHVLEGLDNLESDNLFNLIDDETHFKIMASLENQYTKRGNYLYVAYYPYNIKNILQDRKKSTVISNMSINSKIIDFIRRYRSVDEYPEILRHDPILILIMNIFTRGSGTHLTTKKIFLKPYERYHINTFTKNYDRCNEYEYEEVSIIKGENIFISIPNRPDSLYSDLTIFAQENNFEIDLIRANEYPTEGPYRLFD